MHVDLMMHAGNFQAVASPEYGAMWHKTTRNLFCRRTQLYSADWKRLSGKCLVRESVCPGNVRYTLELPVNKYLIISIIVTDETLPLFDKGTRTTSGGRHKKPVHWQLSQKGAKYFTR